MSTMFGHSEQPGLNCARRGSGICSDWAGENWGTVRPHTAKLRKGRAGGSTFKDQGTSVALTLPLSAPAGMGRAIHMQSSPSRGRRGVWWRAHSRTSRAASGGHHGPCWTRPCSVQESRRSSRAQCTTKHLLCHSWQQGKVGFSPVWSSSTWWLLSVLSLTGEQNDTEWAQKEWLQVRSRHRSAQSRQRRRKGAGKVAELGLQKEWKRF